MGIEFAVRARLGRNSWALTILHKNRGPITLISSEHAIRQLPPRTGALHVGIQIIGPRRPNPASSSVETPTSSQASSALLRRLPRRRQSQPALRRSAKRLIAVLAGYAFRPITK